MTAISFQSVNKTFTGARGAFKALDGVSFDIDLVLGQKPAFSSADFGSPTGLVERAHALGFAVYTWTARVEQALYSVEEYFSHFVNTGADGIFADHPDLLQNYVAGHA